MRHSNPSHSLAQSSFRVQLILVSFLVNLSVCSWLDTTSVIAQSLTPTLVDGPAAQVGRDEFNIAEDQQILLQPALPTIRCLETLKQLLLSQNLSDCCPTWSTLNQDQDIQEELRQIYKLPSKANKANLIGLKPSDLLNEVKQSFFNITELAIDGQQGDSERDKYYNFLDSVNYYLRLLKVANEYLEERVTSKHNESSRLSRQEVLLFEQDRYFKRQLKSIAFRLDRDPLASSFFEELLKSSNESTRIGNLTKPQQIEKVMSLNPNFEYYEDFLSLTKFGQSYAANVSLVRDSVMVMDQLFHHLEDVNMQSNFTKPSKKYMIIRGMSFQLYQIRYRLMRLVSFKVLKNRQDVRQMFEKLEGIVINKPYIKMLGDQFAIDPPGFASCVVQLTHLLDMYLANNLTQVTFYDRLSELPEDFIILGLTFANDYETKEVPKLSRFDTSYYGWQNIVHTKLQTNQKSSNNSGSSNQGQIDARNSNQSLLSKLFS